MGTRWMWIKAHDGRWALAFTYTDRQAGPSAKGAVVVEPLTQEQIRNAVDHPNITFRMPFEGVEISAEDALRMGLPKDPPWIGFYENKPVPPPRGQPSRTVTAVVQRAGRPVVNARVRMGEVFGRARELLQLDQRTTDAAGRCAFPLAPMGEVFAIADVPGASSELVSVPASGVVELELRAFGVLEGTVTQRGVPVAASITTNPLDRGVLRVQRGDAAGRYRIDDLVPGAYDVVVEGIDPKTHMTAGTPTYDRITVREGETVHRDYALIAGAAVEIVLAVENDRHFADVYLFDGVVGPRVKSELVALWKSRDRSTFRSSNSSTNDGRRMKTRFADVPPGEYTLCICPSTVMGGNAEQPVVSTRVVVATAPVVVELVLPSLRP